MLPIASVAQTTKFGSVTLTVERVAAGCPNPCDRDLVIFVHGILGARSTWVNEAAGTYWPALMIADPDLGDLDIVRVDYESYLLNGGPGIEDVVGDLKNAIESLDTIKYRTVQFIAHSLGGMLVRRYLVKVAARYGHKYLSQYRQAILLGTPGNGSYLAKVASLASSNPQLRVLKPVKENDWLQMVNDTVSDIEIKHHSSSCSSLGFYAAVETRPTAAGIVVDRESAIVGATYYEEFERDHLSLVKPDGPKDPVYYWTKRFILSCASGEICPGPHRASMSNQCGNPEVR